MSTKPLDFSREFVTSISATIRTSVLNDVDELIKIQRKLQPEIQSKITRSSVLSILAAEALEARANDSI